ncbi:MAG TPA: hypothetical protein VF733_01635 [Candidatus Saccharimonadales bacterium]
MTEYQPTDLPVEYGHYVLRDLFKRLGDANLLAPPTVERLVAADKEQIAPVAARLLVHANYMAALIKVDEEAAPENPPVGESKADRGLPLNKSARSFLSTLIRIESHNREFWAAAAVSQGQAVAMSETAIEDYTGFRSLPSTRSDCQLDAVRRYVGGVPDKVLGEELGLNDPSSVTVFRSRLCKVLRENHVDGVHTIRRQFLGHLDEVQVDRLIKKFPEFFARSIGDPTDRE